jgi:hypothetical protein
MCRNMNVSYDSFFDFITLIRPIVRHVKKLSLFCEISMRCDELLKLANCLQFKPVRFQTGD